MSNSLEYNPLFIDDETISVIRINYQYGLCKVVLSDMFGLTYEQFDKIIKGLTQGEKQK